MREHEDRLRRLAINDPRTLEALLRTSATDVATSLDPHIQVLVRLGVLVALNGPPSAFDCATAEALAAGATPDEVVDVLAAAAPLVGSALVVSAAPRMARALGYDIDAGLERLEQPLP
jgi:alkylhydroperoxidase/carboxymuconolactone decarboxylase family protein YurZ